MCIHAVRLVALAAMTFAFIAQSRGDYAVVVGYELFQTGAGTTLDGANFMGAPSGSYDFGGGVGIRGTGRTDTIIELLAHPTAPVGGSSTISVQIDALQLETTTPTSIAGLPVGDYFITLQSARGGPISTGSETITFTSDGGGTFDSSFDVFFDLHADSLYGPIVQSADAILTSSATPWSRLAPPGAMAIDGVNSTLYAYNFWPAATVQENGPIGTDNLLVATTPEPSSALVVFTGLSLLISRRSRTCPRFNWSVRRKKDSAIVSRSSVLPPHRSAHQTSPPC
ncbi:MAG: hypothetical protein JWN24_3079 [Phycisphaerales bacterium]|nr:hypothetical protein [Phycisphaerales bacterium]